MVKNFILSFRLFALVFLCGGLALAPAGAETIPPAPTAHFNDYAGRISPGVVRQLDRQLEAFERETSNQLLVALYPRMDSESSVFDYTHRVAQSWRVGQADRNNGAVLFVFLENRQVYLQVGYGLEGALPDAIAKRIVSDEIAPRFRTGDFDGGMTAAVGAMIAATRGEYTGTGRTAADARRGKRNGSALGEFLFIGFIVILSMIFGRRRRRVVLGRGSHLGRSPAWWIGPGMGGGGGFGRGGGGGFGGGGFSGGGGSFGGGGAGGSW